MIKKEYKSCKKKITREDLVEHVKLHYYSDSPENELIWQPYEDCEDDEIGRFIENDVDSLEAFLKEKGIKVSK